MQNENKKCHRGKLLSHGAKSQSEADVFADSSLREERAEQVKCLSGFRFNDAGVCVGGGINDRHWYHGTGHMQGYPGKLVHVVMYNS